MTTDNYDVGVYRGHKVERLTGSYGNLHVFSGSFSPLLDSHREVFDSIDPDGVLAAEYRQGSQCFSSIPSYMAFEISRARIARKSYTDTQMLQVLHQFSGYAPVLVTTGASFADKAALLGSYCSDLVFHVGYNTYNRILEYDGVRGMESIRARFCVWPREGKSLPARHPSNCFSADH